MNREVNVGWWRDLFMLFLRSDASDVGAILDTAHRYIGWIMAIPVAAAVPFTLDGVMTGATLTRIMRNSMLISTAAYFAIFYGFSPFIGNDALWLAFTLYMAIRGVVQYFMSHRLRDVYRKAEA